MAVVGFLYNRQSERVRLCTKAVVSECVTRKHEGRVKGFARVRICEFEGLRNLNVIKRKGSEN